MSSSTAVRKSIKTYFPPLLGDVTTIGQNTPLTLHDISLTKKGDARLFRALWSLVAETMVPQGSLTRSTREAIAQYISERNACPVCYAAHSMMRAGALASEEPDPIEPSEGSGSEFEVSTSSTSCSYSQQEALDYAQALYEATISLDKPLAAGTDKRLAGEYAPTLTSAARAEVALVVLLFQHMNRVVSAILGEEMSTAMFRVPRVLARPMESKGAIAFVNKILAPFMKKSFQKKHQPGITQDLYSKAELGQVLELPKHLQGAYKAGAERAQALARLQAVADDLYQNHLATIVPTSLMEIMDNSDMVGKPKMLTTQSVSTWVSTDVATTLRETYPDDDRLTESVGMILAYVQYWPQCVYNTVHWTRISKGTSTDTARLLVIWWSIRVTLRDARGL